MITKKFLTIRNELLNHPVLRFKINKSLGYTVENLVGLAQYSAFIAQVFLSSKRRKKSLPHKDKAVKQSETKTQLQRLSLILVLNRGITKMPSFFLRIPMLPDRLNTEKVSLERRTKRKNFSFFNF